MTLGGAYVWAGDFDGARPFLEQAERWAPNEGHSFVQAVAPIFSAIAHIESNDTKAAQSEAARAIDIATQLGLSDLQTALAHSVLARTTENADDAVDAAQRGVELARRSSERIMYAYALASGGDVLCHHDRPHGADLIGEARRIIDQCPDPGIAGRYLARGRSPATSSTPTDRSILNSSSTSPTVGPPVLGYLPSRMSQRDRQRARRLAQHRQDPLQGDLPQTRHRRPQSRRPSRPLCRPALTRRARRPAPHRRDLQPRT